MSIEENRWLSSPVNNYPEPVVEDCENDKNLFKTVSKQLFYTKETVLYSNEPILSIFSKTNSNAI